MVVRTTPTFRPSRASRGGNMESSGRVEPSRLKFHSGGDGWSSSSPPRARRRWPPPCRRATTNGNPHVEPVHLLAALVAQPGGVPAGLLEAVGVAGAEPARARQGRRGRHAQRQRQQRRRAAAVARRPGRADRRAGGDDRARRLLRVDRAPAARARRRPRPGRRPAAQRRRHRRRPARRPAAGARRRQGRQRRPRGHLPGAGEVRHRPHRPGPRGPARPRDRPRRRDPPGRAGAEPPHQEQPGADRRARRRQDRRRRGAGAADRRRRRARLAQGQAAGLARPVRHGRGRQVPRRVRGAAQGRARRDPGQRRAGRHLHRRAAHRGRRGRRQRGRDGRRQHAQADARPRPAPDGRRHHPRRVPRADREGPRARAAVPAGLRRRARRHRHGRDPARPQGAVRGAPPRHHHRRRARRRRRRCPTGTSADASCRTRRSTWSTRRPRGCGWSSTRPRWRSTSCRRAVDRLRMEELALAKADDDATRERLEALRADLADKQETLLGPQRPVGAGEVGPQPARRPARAARRADRARPTGWSARATSPRPASCGTAGSRRCSARSRPRRAPRTPSATASRWWPTGSPRTRSPTSSRPGPASPPDGCSRPSRPSCCGWRTSSASG